jgi:hypothetical protein
MSLNLKETAKPFKKSVVIGQRHKNSKVTRYKTAKLKKMEKQRKGIEETT